MVVANEAQPNVVGEAPFNELAKAVGEHRLVGTSTTITGVEGVAEDVALVGRTTISRSETVILQSTSALSGR